MKCPRCVQKIHRAADSCPHCGFSIAQLDAVFGNAEVSAKALTDAAGLLKKTERQQVRNAMQQFGKKFPQLFIAIYTGSFRETANLRQFGFWMLNRAAFEDVDITRPNEAGILLIMDAEGKAASITYGYLLDAFLDEEDTFLALSQAHPLWLERRISDGIIAMIRNLEKTLIRKYKLAMKDPEGFEKKVCPSPQVGDLVKRIRAGNVKAKTNDITHQIGGDS